MIHGVVYTHADLGAALCRAVESMMGQQNGLVGISNEGLSGDAMLTVVEEAIAESSDGAVVFTALFGGSCWRVAEQLTSGRNDLLHVTGVNLPMLLAFVSKRESTGIDELAGILVDYGRRGIKP